MALYVTQTGTQDFHGQDLYAELLTPEFIKKRFAVLTKAVQTDPEKEVRLQVLVLEMWLWCCKRLSGTQSAWRSLHTCRSPS